ncbi:hypothetical protein COOONC_12329, partial [Cooperia oncophora]
MCFLQILFSLPEGLIKDVDPWNLRLWNVSARSVFDQVQMLTAHNELQLRSCDLLLGDNDTLQMLANEKFDAGITEMLGACGFAIFYKAGINHMIAASAMGVVDSIGEYYDLPKFPSIAPSFLLPYSDRMSFLERTINFITIAFADLVSSEIARKYK